MTGPLPDPRDPKKKSLVRVAIGHVTTNPCSRRVECDIEFIADAVREFSVLMEGMGKRPWDIIVTDEISPGRDEATQPHDPQELNEYWTVQIKQIDLYIVHPEDNGSTSLGEQVKIAMDAPGKPLILVPLVEGVEISRFWKGQVRESTRVRFLPVKGRGRDGKHDLESAIKKFLFDNLEDLEAGPERRRVAEVAMLPDSMELEHRWDAAPVEVRAWVANDLCIPEAALYDILTDPIELGAFPVLNYLKLVQALENPDVYTVGRGHIVLKDTPMLSWTGWAATQPTSFSMKILRRAIVRTERALVEVTTPIVLDQVADWASLAYHVENGR